MSLNTEFHPLRVAEVRRETPDAVSIKLEAPDDLKALYRFEAGQYLTFKADLDGEDVRRTYSVCVSPRDGELRIAVKQIAGGVFSTWVNTKLKPGSTIEVMPPMGRFTLPEGGLAGRWFVGFAGGSGITPVLSLLKTTLEGDPTSRFTLFYGNRSSPQVMFLEELAALKNRYLGRLQVFHFLEEEAEDVELFNGRLDTERCEAVLTQLIDPAEVDGFYICGPGPMMDAAESALLARGVDPAKIKIERFTTGRPTAARLAETEQLQQKAQGVRMSVELDGRRSTVRFDAEKGNILDSVRSAGMPAPYACKGGVCATCRAKVTEGSVEMKQNYGLSPEEVAQGYVLTCQSVPTSDTLTLSYDA